MRCTKAQEGGVVSSVVRLGPVLGVAVVFDAVGSKPQMSWWPAIMELSVRQSIRVMLRALRSVQMKEQLFQC
jgi:hypothetical protein